MIKTMMAAGSRAVFGAHIVGSIPTVFIIFLCVLFPLYRISQVSAFIINDSMIVLFNTRKKSKK